MAAAATSLLWLAMRARTWLLAAAGAAVLIWLAWHAWRWMRAVSRAASATAPGGVLAAVADRTLDLESRFADLMWRLDRLERLSDAREQDERHRHEGDVVEVLGALLDLNEVVRGAVGPPRATEGTPGADAESHLTPDVRIAAQKGLP